MRPGWFTGPAGAAGPRVRREIERALLQAVAAKPNIEILPNHMAVDLITAPVQLLLGLTGMVQFH